MNRHMTTMVFRPVLALLATLLFTSPIHAAGLLTPSDGSLPALEIRDHRVGVLIEDGYAITTVEQVFVNPHGRDLEAQYSFPVPEHGTVVELTVWIDDRPVTGEVLEREDARRLYEQEKAAGRDAGITEKDSYRTFETRVSPVRAMQDTRVRIVYLQPAQVDTGIGRYVYPLEEGGVDEAKLAFWTANEQVTGEFSFDLQVRSAYPVAAVRMPNQPQATIQSQSDGEWSVHLGKRLSGIDDAPAQAIPDVPDAVFRSADVEFYGKMNFMKGGVACADKITTVSPTYAEEIQTGEYAGLREPGLMTGLEDRSEARIKKISIAAMWRIIE